MSGIQINLYEKFVSDAVSSGLRTGTHINEQRLKKAFENFYIAVKI